MALTELDIKQAEQSINEDSGQPAAFACRGLAPVVPLWAPDLEHHGLAVYSAAAPSEACAHLSPAQHEVDLNQGNPGDSTWGMVSPIQCGHKTDPRCSHILITSGKLPTVPEPSVPPWACCRGVV